MLETSPVSSTGSEFYAVEDITNLPYLLLLIGEEMTCANAEVTLQKSTSQDPIPTSD